MTSRLALSIVIPVYNRASLLEQVLAGLQQQTLAETEYEILVVDDGSTEPLLQLQQRYTFFYIRLETNSGAATARNRGIAQARGERVLFLDCDGIPDPHLLEVHMQVSKELPEQTIIFGYRYELTSSESKGAMMQQEMKPDLREGLFQAETGDFTHWPAPWQACFTNNLSVPRQLLVQIGGFDEQFRTWGGEDIELGYRLSQQPGVQFKLARNAVVFHQWHERDEAMQDRYNYNNFQYMLQKHRTCDIEMFFASFSITPAKKSIRYNQIQHSLRHVLEVSQQEEATWQSIPDLSLIAHPCAVLGGGMAGQSHEGWHLFHPSLQARPDPISLLGIELPFARHAFASVLLTKLMLRLPDLLPTILQEAFRLAPAVWLELPPSENIDLLAFGQHYQCIVHAPLADGRLCRLEPETALIDKKQ